MSKDKVGGENIDPKRLKEAQKAYLNTIFSFAEEKYGSDVNLLLKSIMTAKAKGDLETLKKAQKIVRQWNAYFKELIKLAEKIPYEDDPTKKPTLEFAQKQLEFFDKLLHELNQIISGTDFNKLKKSLEK